MLRKLVEQRMSALEMSYPDLLAQLGYKDIDKGRLRFRRFLMTGSQNETWLRRIARVLDIDLLKVIAANRATVLVKASSKEDGKAVAFKPFIEIEIDRQSVSETVWLLSQRRWKLQLPSGLMNRDSVNEFAVVKQLFAEYCKENNHRLMGCAIVGFSYHRQAGQTLLFDRAGSIRQLGVQAQETRQVAAVSGLQPAELNVDQQVTRKLLRARAQQGGHLNLVK